MLALARPPMGAAATGRAEPVAMMRRFADLRSRIGRSVRLMERTLESALTLDDLAAAACLSPYHYLRIYALMAGETPIATHRRLRLTHALRRMREAGVGVTEAAFDAGFTTPDGFSRAFRRQFGERPSTWTALAVTAAPSRRLEERPDRTLLVGEQGAEDGAPERGYLDLVMRNRDLFGVAEEAEIVAFGEDRSIDSITRWPRHVFGLRLCPRAMAASPSRRIVLPGGAFVVFPFVGSFDICASPHAALEAQTATDGHIAVEGPWLKRFHNDPEITPASEVRWDLLLPARRVGPPAARGRETRRAIPA
jgi:AraC family transcriptional regulator